MHSNGRIGSRTRLKNEDAFYDSYGFLALAGPSRSVGVGEGCIQGGQVTYVELLYVAIEEFNHVSFLEAVRGFGLVHNLTLWKAYRSLDYIELCSSCAPLFLSLFKPFFA